jgi:hypothetical protein
VNPEEIEARLNNRSSDASLNIDFVIKLLSDADPTPNKEFFAWILTQYVNNKIRLPEDNHVVQQDLTFYATIKKNGVLKRLLNQIKTKLGMEQQNPMDLTTLDRDKLQQVVDAVKELTDGDTQSKRQKIAVTKQEGAISLYHDDTWELVQVEEGDAACYYAKGTRWCTSSKSTANYYLNQGPLYILYEHGKPFAQIHLPSKQMMDPQDRKIQNLPDEAGKILLDHIPDLDETDKIFICRHCDKHGDLYEKYVGSLKKLLKNMVKDAGLRDEISVSIDDDYMDEYGEMFMRGEMYFEFDLNKALVHPKEIENNHRLPHDIRDALRREINISDNPYISTYGNKLTVSFEVHEENPRDNEEDKLEELLSTLKSYNDEDDYLKLKQKIYNVFVDEEILERNISEDDHEWLYDNNLSHFEFDTDDYYKEGAIHFESKPYSLCKIDEVNWSQEALEKMNPTRKGLGFVMYFNLEGDMKPLEDVFENIYRKHLSTTLQNHRKQGWIPYPDAPKPRLPQEAGYHRLAPKIKVTANTV